jgi:amino acid adenylation domain-containing protein
MAYVLQQLLSASAKRNPEKAAVSARGSVLTYGELERQSNQLAQLLQARGLKRGERVGLYFPKSVESLVAMFGVLKAGGVYVPLDPQAPAERVGYIVDNCQVKVLITTGDRLHALDPAMMRLVEFTILLSAAGNGSFASAMPWGALAEYPSTAPDEQSITTDLAYILYTSGSTGRPKGVMLTHQNALTFVQWCADTFQVTADDNLSNHAPLHFDLSVFDVYNSVEAGATLHLVTEDMTLFPASLTNFIRTRQISIWYSVPSALVLLLLHGNLRAEDLPRLRIILFAGEVFAMKYLRQLTELLPQVELYNLYGPTETNVCTFHRVDRDRLEGMTSLPIGRACGNSEVFAVGENDQIVAAGSGQEGELYVRGPGVTPGYWADLEKTNKACIQNRFQKHFEEKMYRTGDIVTVSEDGEYCYVGRRDSMVKSRGYRIELGEIEAALLSHHGVREAAALAIPDDEVGARLRAVVAPHKRGSLSAKELQQHCASRIPKYMIPEEIELRDSLPKTSTGKVDRVQLAAPQPLPV